jgi:hypothetical protein
MWIRSLNCSVSIMYNYSCFDVGFIISLNKKEVKINASVTNLLLIMIFYRFIMFASSKNIRKIKQSNYGDHSFDEF